MRGQLSLAAVAALTGAVSGAVVPVAEVRAGAGGVVEAPRISVPPWFLSLAAELDAIVPTDTSSLLAPSSNINLDNSSPLPTPIESSLLVQSSPPVESAAPVQSPQPVQSPPPIQSPPPAPASSFEPPTSSSLTEIAHQSSAGPTTPASPSDTPTVKTCPGPAQQFNDVYWLRSQDHNGEGAGYAPFTNAPNRYPVFRNVMDYNVVNDGSGDQTARLQKAIDDDGNGGSRKGRGVTRNPAEVFLPGGTYQLGSTLTLTVGTIIVGDPNNPPIIKAGPNFQGEFLVMGYDKMNGNPETSFMMLIKNVILDTTAVSPSQSITALQWGVAQGAGLTNIQVRMPTGPSQHTGINIVAGSTIAVTDVTITGGATGIINSNQQVNFKNVHFIACGTAFEASGGWTVLLQGAVFESCGTGVNMTTNALGSLVILDSVSTNSGPLIRFHDSSHDAGYQNSQFLIQNLEYNSKEPIAVDTNGHTRLEPTAHVDTWVWGSMVPGAYAPGGAWNTHRSPQLLVDGKYFTKAQPTYAGVSGQEIVNVKTVPGHVVKGDGATDDTVALNAILAQNAANCKITYIPFGVYRVSDTLLIPVGSRIVGEAWSVISGYGDAFRNPDSPRPVVRVGNPGDVGTIEIQDMRFSVAEVLPGAKVLEINAAGQQPGDVGLWNTMVMVGGTAETSISATCTSQDPKDCMAAYMIMHLTETSSAYIENFWGWTADHNLDSKSLFTIISTGRGILVESTKGTWLTGTGSEHHWLYNYNFHKASNIFAGLLQSESPYMQGSGEFEKAPAPWTVNPAIGDPDFSWCGPNDDKCRTALATNVDGGSNIALYNSAAWAFFDGSWNGLYNEPCQGKCQANMMRVTGAPQNLIWYSISTRMTEVIVLDGKTNPREDNHAGGWEGIIQAYGEFAG